jgi:hypothetical protein
VYVFGSSGRLRPALWSSEGGKREKWLDWNSPLVTNSEVNALPCSCTLYYCTLYFVSSVACLEELKERATSAVRCSVYALCNTDAYLHRTIIASIITQPRQQRIPSSTWLVNDKCCTLFTLYYNCAPTTNSLMHTAGTSSATISHTVARPAHKRQPT